MTSLQRRHNPLVDLERQATQSSPLHHKSLSSALLILMLVGVFSAFGCSDSDMAAYEEAPTLGGPENAGEDGASYTPEPNSAGELAAGEFAAGEFAAGESTDEDFADMGIGTEASESCGSLAVPDRDLADNHNLVDVCLEGIFPVVAGDEPEMAGQNRSSSDPICGVADKLSEALSAEGVEVTCVDEDGDCYYVCEGWTLPSTFQDLDDRRDFITNEVDGEVAAAPNENAPCLNLTSVNEPTCCELNSGSAASLVCRIPIPSRDDETVQRVQVCQGGAVLWVSERSGALSLHATQLNPLEAGSGQTTRLIDELALTLTDVAEIAELQCETSINQSGSRSLSVMFTDGQRRLHHVSQSLSGQYLAVELYTGDERVVLNGEGAQDEPTQITLSDTEWGVENIKINDQGFFSWELSVTTTDEDARTLRYISYEYNPTPVFIPDTVIDQAITPAARGIKVASLDEFGALSFALINQGMTDPIRYEASNYNRLMSSASVLAQASSGPSASARFLLWGSDNFWEDPNSTLRIPLVLSAAQLGFETLEVDSISGMIALLKLNDSVTAEGAAETGSAWGLYDIMSDRLHLFDWSALLSGLFSDLGFTLKAPRLVNNRIFWIEDALSRDDDATRQTAVISIQLNR